MKQKIKEWFSIRLAKKPSGIVLCVILVFNLVFLLISALLISALSLSGTEKMGLFEAAFCTITMILDAGCIQFVINDIGHAGVAISLVCLSIIFVGMITFTGAVIGYVTNYISNFINTANSGNSKLNLKEHIIILNWNTRASEIINDNLYDGKRKVIVVLSNTEKSRIEKEITERLSDTVFKENNKIKEESKDKLFFAKINHRLRHRFKNKLDIIVREGDVFSFKQLTDISMESAKSIIILGNDTENNLCKYKSTELKESAKKGNTQTIKTLMQVANISSMRKGNESQKIIVEITDNWTAGIVNKIVEWKQREGQNNIVPIRVNTVLGQILAQFSVMPELNSVYEELFSNRGAEFYSERVDETDDVQYNLNYFSSHYHSIPLSSIKNRNGSFYYYTANEDKDLSKESKPQKQDLKVSLNPIYQLDPKYVLILGHNTKSNDIMEGFSQFNAEWNTDENDPILKVVVIDDKKSLESANNYKKYNFVIETIATDIYDRDKIYSAIKKYVSKEICATSILILSDDTASSDNMDSNSLTHLVYVQDIISSKAKENSEDKIDVIVEIINPKHVDVVRSYNVKNAVISNRYISKMIVQIGDKDALFDFYKDILTYDENPLIDSKEIYLKKVDKFFNEIPRTCTAAELIRAVYNASIQAPFSTEKLNPVVVLGYVKSNGEMVIFGGDQNKITVELNKDDKLITYSNH